MSEEKTVNKASIFEGGGPLAVEGVLLPLTNFLLTVLLSTMQNCTPLPQSLRASVLTTTVYCIAARAIALMLSHFVSLWATAAEQSSPPR